ncbi:methylmalonyl Co-A mutase-associated GTPase MeaB [Paroceanicella profunda]|uniref:Methylmalonyl Co-A mutase-associated GTPase MeaB n=1 Tax=Paroceanicella profunda TaxID=2579971 RepID=A0A5B8FIW2_9RHOB|nr:methylmalonyl Co-A mutase-associated GTPase MeaB [Paroceanicella profunda]
MEALRGAGKAGLARALSRIESAPDAPETVALLDAAFAAPRGVTLGFTGPPGVGKSTLVNALVPRVRGAGHTLGIIAVDPSSRRSGGALLGDRTRMTHDPEDQGVFMRSMAARDRLGGVAEVTFPAMVLMRALFDIVIVETVGVGQSETEISELADLTILCSQPGAGDALQFMKAGIMETPDLVLVTKGDTGAPARRTASDLAGALSLAARQTGIPAPGVVIVSANDGSGLDRVLGTVLELAPGVNDGRREQAANMWLRSQIRTDWGRFGLELLGQDLRCPKMAPFSARSGLSARLWTRLQPSR